MEHAEGMDFTESRSEKLYREDRTVNLDKAMERTKKALDGALVEYEMRWFDNGPVIAVPSFGAGRIASIFGIQEMTGSEVGGARWLRPREGGERMNTKSTSDEVNHEAVLEAGKNLVQGLIDGANSKSQALVDAVAQFAKGSVDAISRGGRVMEFPKHTAYEFLVESGLHDQADELMELMEKQEALEAKDDGAGARPE